MRLADNPFHILDVSTQQSRREILSAATERALSADERLVREARSVLVHPIKRISAEVAWLPGVELDRVRHLFAQAKADPVRMHDVGELSALALANLRSEALIHLPTDVSVPQFAQWVASIAEAHSEVEVESTVELLNADRREAGLPDVTRPEVVEMELNNRRRHFRRTIEMVLDQQPLLVRADVLAAAVESTTSGGQQAPVLIDDLVDGFEDEHRSALQEGAVKIGGLCEDVLKSASNSRGQDVVQVRMKDGTSKMMRIAEIFGADEDAITAGLKELVDTVYAWDRLAQPGQLNARSRGLRHDLSLTVAGMIRKLALTLHNEHGMSRSSQELTGVLLRAFAEIDVVVEVSKKDAETLSRMVRGRRSVPRSSESDDRTAKGDRGNSHNSSFGCMMILVVVVVLLGVGFVIYDMVGNDPDSVAANEPSVSSSDSASARRSVTESEAETGQPRPSQSVSVRPQGMDSGLADRPYSRPSVGSGQRLSVLEIRWCLRQDIKLESIREIVSSNHEVARFNELVSDYNSRCSNFRYRSGSLDRARRYVESRRDRIESDAITEFRR